MFNLINNLNQSYHRVINTFINSIFNGIIILFFYSFGASAELLDFALCLFVYQYFFILVEWGFNLYAIEKVENIHFLIKRKYFVNIFLISKLYIGFLASVLFIFFGESQIFSIQDKYYLYSSALLIFVSSFNPFWLYQAIKKIQLFNYSLLFCKLIQIIFLTYFINGNNFYLFFISQSFVVLVLFVNLIYLLKNEANYFFKFKFKFFISSYYLIKKLFFYFASNFYNNINLSIWGFGLMFINHGMELILFNIVDLIWRTINVILQSILEPLFKGFRNSIIPSINFTILFSCFLIIIFFNIENATKLLFPKFYDHLFEIFKLLYFVIIFFSFNKIISFLIIGKEKISLMNTFNSIFLLIQVLFFINWLLHSGNNTYEIIKYLLFFNIFIFFILIIYLFLRNRKKKKLN